MYMRVHTVHLYIYFKLTSWSYQYVLMVVLQSSISKCSCAHKLRAYNTTEINSISCISLCIIFVDE